PSLDRRAGHEQVGHAELRRPRRARREQRRLVAGGAHAALDAAPEQRVDAPRERERRRGGALAIDRPPQRVERPGLTPRLQHGLCYASTTRSLPAALAL